MKKLYTTNASRLTTSSKGYKILHHIIKNHGATKYECLTKALGKVGDKNQLRGYYSGCFRGWMESGVVSYDRTTYKYHITPKGAYLYSLAV